MFRFLFDLVEPQIVGDVEALLLKIVGAKDEEVVNAQHLIMTTTFPNGSWITFRRFRKRNSGQSIRKDYDIGCWFKRLFRTALPFLSRGAKSVGKEALKTGTYIINDLLEGQNLEDAAKHRAKETGRKLAREAIKNADDMLGQVKKYKIKKRF
ncbi:uncharacterized protein F54H12.2 [Trichonephila inaurata madagascariensis]|uniref:Uncharacterized protein F54H12.2 n=1 Tax=Trichonephila inaurata madagascariensis TaxID=2747483 RepID=A0A8X6WUA8_9ARAC|nr:uncharacterized protein F54H12.2 [Trichonephila inaurata madagascariensis]